MSNRSTDDNAVSRAEARRRARLVARGELPEEEPEPTDAEPAEREGFLRRLFPPAPPLPNRPDPLAGFDTTRPLRPIRERLFLLRRNPLAWTVTAVLSSAGYLIASAYQATFLGLVGTFAMFGALIAAGWFGWQRPTLFGTTAGVLGFALTAAVIIAFFSQRGATPDAFGIGQVAGSLAFQALTQAGLGFLGGWYGGYLRRRQTQLNARVGRRR